MSIFPNSDSLLLTLPSNINLCESKCLNCQMEKNSKKAFIQLEKIVGFAQYLKTTTGQRILLCSALSHFTMVWFQIKDIDCCARCEEKEKTSLETISSSHYFNRNKKSTSY